MRNTTFRATSARATALRVTALRAAGFGLFAVVVLSGCAPASESAEQVEWGPKVSVPAPEVEPQVPEAEPPAPAVESPAPEAEPPAPPKTQAVPAQPDPAPAQTRLQPKLSEKRAQGIALGHARVPGGTPIYCNIDYEDDLPRANPEWDCEFVASEHEYSYEIDAVTGNIVNYEKESVWD